MGTVIFLKFGDVIKHVGNPPSPVKLKISVLVFAIAFLSSILVAVMLYFHDQLGWIMNMFGVYILVILGRILYESNDRERKNIIVLISFAAFFMLIYAIEMHLGSLINLFTDRHIDRVIFGYEISPASLQSINPLAVLIFTPFIAMIFVKNMPFLRFALGIVSMILCFLILHIGCINHNEIFQSNIACLVIAMIFMSLAEIFVTPVLFSMCTTLAPKRIQGFMMGVIMLTLSYATLFGGGIAKLIAVPKNTSAAVSLTIYKDGFSNIVYLYIVGFILFIMIIPLLKKLLKYS
ncbi:MAG: POT family proton-dependent oligopeptide transporter [Candidatus Midichloriaceae bacterium]